MVESDAFAARLTKLVSKSIPTNLQAVEYMSVDWEAFTDRTIEAAEVRLLGLTDAMSVLALQKLMVHDVRIQRTISASVLICEHPPIVTQGRNGTILDLPSDPRELESRLIKVLRVDRDGGTILHQSGQLAVYVIASLEEIGIDLPEYQRRLQDAMIQVCQESKVKAFRKDGDENALWGRQGLLCEFGIGLDQSVTTFGAFLNVGCPLDQAKAAGRGLRGDRISSLNAERNRPALMPDVRAAVTKHVCEQLGYSEYHIHTGHPFLARTRKFTGESPHAESLLNFSNDEPR